MNPNNPIFIRLVGDAEFVRWVRYPNLDTDRFWQNWRKNHPDQQLDFDKAFEFVRRLDFGSGQLSETETEEMLGAILRGDAKKRVGLHFKLDFFGNWFSTQWVRVAAILLISLLGGLGFEKIFPQQVDAYVEQVPTLLTFENPRGRKSKIKLPDGTLVHLSYESTLTFPEYFTGGVRRVDLVGEAFFDVVPDTLPFQVGMDGVLVEVLGTSFNARAIMGEFKTQVSLVTGKLRVNFSDKHLAHEKRVLTPGEQLSLDKKSGTYLLEPFHVESAIAWTDGILLFREASLSEFFDRLEKWYGVNIQVFGSPSKTWKITGSYDNEKLEDILHGLKFVYPLDYQINGKNVTLKFK
ncbi:putative anti-sigma factor [Lunatimonas lonarensis]|uniref:Putative anti-sigma factor n=1 Tax=Lunatimonas lonarensis TaxID=1232681 RepID=R7ZVP9_9BACT|nr:FecR domain-containing protein [Lunatimonas lonarensis]EON78162.1 putative anti-sigma factor [Lunatimonas lonarensis]